MKYRYILLIGLLGLLFGCQPEIEEFNVTKGNADFSTYVALGNSLTAGYSDGALYNSAQSTSFPAIIAQQFAKAGGGTFVQPVVNSEYGVFPGKLMLGYKEDCLGQTNLSPVPDSGYLDGPGPVGYLVNNMGVPGARSSHLLAPGYGMLNPYFGRFNSSPLASVLGDALAMNPTFFTLWIGNNDVLGYSMAGGVGDTITSQVWYAAYLNIVLDSLTSTGAQGAIANIPDVTSIPFFNTVPANGYTITQDQADTLNKYLGPLGFSYQAGANYFIVEDPTSPLGFRQMVPGELLLLTVPQDSLKCAYWGGYNPALLQPVPIPTQYALTMDEITLIRDAVAGYNQTIEALAAQYNLAYVDMYDEFNDLQTGIISNGITLTTGFITGNAFSLDGIHATPMGYSYVANVFINAINAKFGCTLPIVSLTDYQANILP